MGLTGYSISSSKKSGYLFEIGTCRCGPGHYGKFSDVQNKADDGVLYEFIDRTSDQTVRYNRNMLHCHVICSPLGD